jgi:hypothetical protein
MVRSASSRVSNHEATEEDAIIGSGWRLSRGLGKG